MTRNEIHQAAKQLAALNGKNYAALTDVERIKLTSQVEAASKRKSVSVNLYPHDMRTTITTLKSGVIRIRVSSGYYQNGEYIKVKPTVVDYAACDSDAAMARWALLCFNMDNLRPLRNVGK